MATPNLDVMTVLRGGIVSGLETRLRLAGEDLGAALAKELLEDPAFRAEWKRLAGTLATALREQLAGQP